MPFIHCELFIGHETMPKYVNSNTLGVWHCIFLHELQEYGNHEFVWALSELKKPRHTSGSHIPITSAEIFNATQLKYQNRYSIIDNPLPHSVASISLSSKIDGPFKKVLKDLFWKFWIKIDDAPKSRKSYLENRKGYEFLNAIFDFRQSSPNYR